MQKSVSERFSLFRVGVMSMYGTSETSEKTKGAVCHTVRPRICGNRQDCVAFGGGVQLERIVGGRREHLLTALPDLGELQNCFAEGQRSRGYLFDSGRANC